MRSHGLLSFRVAGGGGGAATSKSTFLPSAWSITSFVTNFGRSSNVLGSTSNPVDPKFELTEVEEMMGMRGPLVTLNPLLSVQPPLLPTQPPPPHEGP